MKRGTIRRISKRESTGSVKNSCVVLKQMQHEAFSNKLCEGSMCA